MPADSLHSRGGSRPWAPGRRAPCWRPRHLGHGQAWEVSVGTHGPLGSPWRAFRVWVPLSVVSCSTSRWRRVCVPVLTRPITPLRKPAQSGGWSLRKDADDCWLCWGLEHSLSFEKSRGKPFLWVILDPGTHKHLVESQAGVGRARRYTQHRTH